MHLSLGRTRHVLRSWWRHPADHSHSVLDGSVVTLSRATAAVPLRRVPAAVAIVLSLSMVAGAPAPRRVEAVASTTAGPRPPRALSEAAPWGDGQRAADRVIERRVRGAIRADPFLALAAPRVRVT